MNRLDQLTIKIEAARELIQAVLKTHRRPVVMSSFGKDSMVLLHLIRGLSPELPVLFHREPFMPAKYEFANRIIHEWNLTVYDYRPARVAVVKVGEEMEILNYYQNGWLNQEPTFNLVPTGIVEPRDGEPFLCGKEDLLGKPLGAFNWPWDLAFIGHKASDADKVNGSIPLRTDVVQNPGCDMAYPLRHFTDNDVWEYHARFNVPIHRTRYNLSDGFKEFTDKRKNPDYFEACTKCFDRDQPAVVRCPRSGLELTNIHAQVRYEEPFKREYFTAPQPEETHAV